MTFRTTVSDLVKRRFSCRTYLKIPIEGDQQHLLSEFLASNQTGPLGTSARFALIAATDQDSKSLKGLGTYGTIRGATGFIVGAWNRDPRTWKTMDTSWSTPSCSLLISAWGRAGSEGASRRAILQRRLRLLGGSPYLL